MSLTQLQTATNCLLNNDNHAAIHTALNQIHAICSDISTVRGDILETHHDNDAFLADGVAISPNMAARCLFDPLRTVQFLRGIHAGIHEAMRRFADEPIHIVYAGCGPYATLLLPLTTQFSPEQIQITLIDINKPSMDGVQRIINTLEIDRYISACIQADAATYQHPPGQPIHMVISETMQTGLAREPQVSIMQNFLPQLVDNGIFIPENIVIEATLSSSKQEDIGLLMHRDTLGFPVGRENHHRVTRVPVGRIFALNAETVTKKIHGNSIPLTTLEIPARDTQFDQFLLLTTVTIFNEFGFEPYDCELSFPLRLHDLSGVDNGRKVQFSYVFGRKPGLQHQLLPI